MYKRQGTQCAKIVKEYGFVHLSAGDLLRAERDSGSPDGELIESYIRQGTIVPVEITINLIRKAMSASATQKFVIDGFPRNENNLEGWERVMGDKCNLKFVLFLECPEETCLNRAMGREDSSGARRSDDDPEVFKKRYRTYVTQTMPIIQTFEKRGLVRTISAVPGPEKVFEEVKKLFQGL